MKINIDNFIELIKKATINYSIDYCQLTVSKEKINCSIKNNLSSIIVKLDVKNNVFSDVTEDFILNIIDAGQTIVPYLQLFDKKKEVEVKYTFIRDNHIKNFDLKQDKLKSRLNFAEPIITRLFSGTLNIGDAKEIFSITIDEDFIDNYEKLKKIAVRTGKIYFSVKDKILSFIAGDTSLSHLNSFSVEIEEKNFEDIEICFDFKYYMNVISILNLDENLFDIVLLVKTKNNSPFGILDIVSKDKSEEYFIASMR